MKPAEAAVIAAGLRLTKQALKACRTATQRLAAAGDLDVYAEIHCERPEDIDRLTSVVALAVEEHPHGVEIVVLTTTPPRPH